METKLEGIFSLLSSPFRVGRWRRLDMGCMDPGGDSFELYSSWCGQEDEVGAFPPGLKVSCPVTSNIDRISDLEVMWDL